MYKNANSSLQLSLRDACTPKKGCKRSQTIVEFEDSPASRTRSKVGDVPNEERSRAATVERGVLSISVTGRLQRMLKNHTKLMQSEEVQTALCQHFSAPELAVLHEFLEKDNRYEEIGNEF